METARAPSHVRGLAIAMILGIVLAVAAVGAMAKVPSSVDLTGASLRTPAPNSTKTDQGGQPPTSIASSSNATGGLNSLATTNSTVNNVVNMNQFIAAISGGEAAGTSNSTVPANTYGNYSAALQVSTQDKSAIMAAELRDLAIFGVAGALALAAFLLSRRRIA